MPLSGYAGIHECTLFSYNHAHMYIHVSVFMGCPGTSHPQLSFPPQVLLTLLYTLCYFITPTASGSPSKQ